MYSIIFNKESLFVQTNSWINVFDSFLSLNMCIRVRLMSIASTLPDASTSKRAATSKLASLTPSLGTQC